MLAHELGHHVHRHILKSIAVQAGSRWWDSGRQTGYCTMPWNALHMFETVSDFANLPLLVLVSTVLSFLLAARSECVSPATTNARPTATHFSPSPASDPFISSMNKLADQNLAERSPARWVEWFFHSHPAISRRVAAAEAWAKLQTAASRK